MSMGAALDLIEDVQCEMAKYTSAKYAIAGGCIRDAFFGKVIKDIDLVVYDERPWAELTDWPAGNDYGPTGEFMAADTNIRVLGKYPVQLIWRPQEVSVAGMMEYHSLSISNFFFIDGTLVIDPQALKDFRDKKHTLNRRRWAKDSLAETRSTSTLRKYRRSIRGRSENEVHDP